MLATNLMITTESKLSRLRKIDEEIKKLEAEYSMLKESVIKNFFIYKSVEEFKTEKGLVLATYRPFLERRFNTLKFKTDFQDIYENYKEEKIVYKFLLKK